MSPPSASQPEAADVQAVLEGALRSLPGLEQRGEGVAQVVSAQRRTLVAAQTGGVDGGAQDARAQVGAQERGPGVRGKTGSSSLE